MKQRLSMMFAIILLCTLSSCGDDGTTVSESGITTETVTTETAAVTEPAYAPKLPETDMSGEEFTVLTCGWGYKPLAVVDILPDGLTGDSINDRAYERAMHVMEEYGCTLVWAEYDQPAEGNDVLKRSVSAGDDEFDIALIRGTHYYNHVSTGALYDLQELPHVNLNAPYYDYASKNVTTLKGKTFGIVSDLSTARYQTVSCVFANLQLLQDYDLGNIYEIVRNGEWTFEKMFEMGANHEADLDGNGSYNNKDRYTVTYINNSIPSYILAAGAQFAHLTEDGYELTYDTEENVDKMMKVSSYFVDTSRSYYYHVRSSNPEDEHNMFMQRNSLFHTGGIYHGSLFRTMEDDFAILPLPKLDASQEQYVTAVFNDTISITTVPVTNTKPDHTGILLEEMCYLGKRDLYPTLYEVVLKSKIARDADSTEMIDLIFENPAYDAGIFYSSSLYSALRTRFARGDQNFASTFKSMRKSLERSFSSLLEDIES